MKFAAPLPVAVVGAGPYGLSLAAHLRGKAVPFRIFGSPMHSWREKMPAGMFLKSDGFASSLYDPLNAFTLAHYSAEKGLPYADVGYPVPIATFIDYGLEFQRRLVGELEQTSIVSIRQSPGGFTLTTEEGEQLEAARVVLAAGITHFAYTPPEFAGFPSDLLSHSSDWGPLDRLRGRRVAVIGGGSSAIDLAAALHQEGAEVHVIARRSAIAFHEPPANGPRSLAERISNPRSGLGLGWRSRLCTDAPLLFHRMPQKFRHRVVRSHLGPAPGWFVREKVEGVVPMHLGASVEGVVESGAGLEVRYRNGAGPARLAVDHLVAATGYRPLLERLTFLDQPLRAKLRSEEGTARLTANFESSVPGLYLVGLASANCFGPLARFAYGARFTARRLSAHLAGHA